MNQQNRRIFRAMACLVLLLAAVVTAALIPFVSTRSPKYPLPPHLNVNNETIEGMDIASSAEWDEYYMAVYYPVTDNQQVNTAVTAYVNKAVEEFKARVTPSREQAKDEFSLSFTASRFDEEIVSFLFKTYTSYAADEGSSGDLRAMTFDLAAGEELGLAAIFSSEHALEILSAQGYAQLSNGPGYEGAAQPQLDKLAEGLAPDPDNFYHFTLDGNLLRFYFPKEQLGSDRPEFFEISLEHRQLRKLLNERFSKALPPVPEPEFPSEISSKPLPPDLTGLEGKKLIALTFDDGPHPQLTPRLLDILAKEEAAATFFVLGSMANNSPKILLRAFSEGHQIASHTYSHKNLVKLTAAQRKGEIDRAAEVIANATGYPPSVMRPPYGAYDKVVQGDAGTPLILWAIDPRDWDKGATAESVSKHILDRAADGDIVLLHDIHESSIDATALLIPALKEKGFTFVTVDQLIALRGSAQAGDVVNRRAP